MRFSPEAQLDSKGPSVQFGTETVSPSDHVRVLGVTFRLTSLWTSTLPVFAHRAFIGCANYDVSDDPNSTKTLVHAFTASRVDYCNAILAGSPRSMTDKPQHLMNAAARLVTQCHKFDHGLSRLLHDDLHWLDVPERIQYKIGITVHHSLQVRPQVPDRLLHLVSEIASRRHLRSASRHHLSVPR